MVSSIGVDFKAKDIIVNNKKVKLQLWDTAGHERFRTITTSYYRGAHGIATVFDLTDRDSFEHVEKWLGEINKYAKENVMRFLIGNKSDLVDKRVVKYEEVRALANKLKIYYVETSAKNNINISDFFEKATQEYLNKYDFKKDKELFINLIDLNYYNEIIEREFEIVLPNERYQACELLTKAPFEIENNKIKGCFKKYISIQLRIK